MSLASLYSNENKLSWFCASVTALISASLVFIAVLNAYYVSGDMQDIGWNSTNAWHNVLSIQGPPAFPSSFFNVHMSLIFWVTNLFSYILPLSKINFFAALCGCIYSLFAVGIYRLWRLNGGQNASATIIALATTFSAIGMQALRLPHIEMAIPALGLWFFLSIIQKKTYSAIIFFTLCLMVREDAGFHLFGILFLWLLTLKISDPKTPLPRNILAFAAASVCYSIIIMIVKGSFFAIYSNMSTIYAGNPPWQHLTYQLITTRIDFFFYNRTYITLPFLVSIIWAIRARNPLLPLGYIAAIPWLIFNLLAIRPCPAALNFYYPFPFWLALAWPLIATLLWKCKTKEIKWPYFLILLFSLIGWQKERFIVYPLDNNVFDAHPFLISEEWGQQRAVQTFIDYFTEHKELFKKSAIDMPVFSIVIDVNNGVLWIGDWNKMNPHFLPEMIVYFDKAYEWTAWVEPTLDAYPGHYKYYYALPKTKIRLASIKPLEEIIPSSHPFVSTK